MLQKCTQMNPMLAALRCKELKDDAKLRLMRLFSSKQRQEAVNLDAQKA